jgi:hypothetical protein
MRLKARRWKIAAALAAPTAVAVAMAATPATSHVSGWAHNWSQHIKPKADQRYYTKSASNARFLPGGVIPGGRTLRGTFSIDGTATAAGQQNSADVSFGYTLASAPTTHFIAAGTAAPPECPGTAANPQAAAGHLCVYEAGNTNVGTRLVYDPVGYVAPAANKHGFGIYMYGTTAAGFYTSHGSWAVTTPAAGTSSARSAAPSSLAAPGGGPRS